MKKLRLFFLLLCPTCWTFAQGVQTPLMTTVLPGLNASWPGECGAGALDNQSQVSRQNVYHSVAAQGAGSWTVTLQYSNTSCTGPWTTYSSINQSSSPAIAVGLDSPFAPAKFIKVAITGAAIATYAGERGLFINPGSGTSVTFPITIAQGGTGGTSTATAWANLGALPNSQSVILQLSELGFPALTFTYNGGSVAQSGDIFANFGGMGFVPRSIASGVVNVSGTSVTLVSGNNFPANMAANYQRMVINGMELRVASNDGTTATLSYPAGTANGVKYQVRALNNWVVEWPGGINDPQPSSIEDASTAWEISGRPGYPPTNIAQWNPLQAIVSTNGTAVTWVSGIAGSAGFDAGMGSNHVVEINGVAYTSTYNSPSSLTLTTSAGVQTAVPFEDFHFGSSLPMLWGQGMNGGITQSFQAKAKLTSSGLWAFGLSVGNVQAPLAQMHVSSGSTAIPAMCAGESAPNVFSTADGTLTGISVSGGTATAYVFVPEDFTFGSPQSGWASLVQHTLFTISGSTTTGLNVSNARMSLGTTGCLPEPGGITPACRIYWSTSAADGTYTVLTDPNLLLTVTPGCTYLDFSEAYGVGHAGAIVNGASAPVQEDSVFVPPLCAGVNLATCLASQPGAIAWCPDCSPTPSCYPIGTGAGAFAIYSPPLGGAVCNGVGEYSNPTVGANVDSAGSPAGTITATGPMFHVTGTSAISTMTPPSGFLGGQICLIADGAYTITSSGNFKVAQIAAIVGTSTCFVYDISTGKWYPSSYNTTASNPASAAVVGTNSSKQTIAADANALSSPTYVAGGGTAQAQTATLSPAITAYVAGETQLCWLPLHANTAAGPTLAVNGLAATTIVKVGGAALVANDLTTTAIACAVYDGTSFELQNPQTGVGLPSGSAGGDLSGTYPNPTVAQVNGAAVPASAAVAGTNGSNQLIAATLASADVWVGNGSNVPTATATTGSGNVVLATSPTLVTPALGTPSAIVLTHGTGLPPAGLAASSWSSLTDGATVTWAIGSVLDAQATVTFTTHGGSRTLAITNPVVGGAYTLKLIQDSSGTGEGLTLGSGCTWKVSGGGSGAITPSTGANAVDLLGFTYDGTYCYAVLTKNYN